MLGKSWMFALQGSGLDVLHGTVIARTSVTTQTSVNFGFFYVLYRNFGVRHYFKFLMMLTLAKNS